MAVPPAEMRVMPGDILACRQAVDAVVEVGEHDGVMRPTEGRPKLEADGPDGAGRHQDEDLEADEPIAGEDVECFVVGCGEHRDAVLAEPAMRIHGVSAHRSGAEIAASADDQCVIGGALPPGPEGRQVSTSSGAKRASIRPPARRCWWLTVWV